MNKCDASCSSENSLFIGITGTIDIYNAENFKEQLLKYAAMNADDLRLDCSKLEYIDSQGLNQLAVIYNYLKLQHRNLIVKNLKQNIKKLFFVTNMHQYLILVD